MFSKKDVQQLANSTSYQRGQSYFNSGSVKKLKRNGNVFEAVVHGSEKYDVSLTLDKKKISKIMTATAPTTMTVLAST
jgi:uncharacterized Zn finger protein